MFIVVVLDFLKSGEISNDRFKMADHIASIDVVSRHHQKLYHLVEQAQGYRINVYLSRSDLTERESRAVFLPPFPLYHGGGMK